MYEKNISNRSKQWLRECTESVLKFYELIGKRNYLSLRGNKRIFFFTLLITILWSRPMFGRQFRHTRVARFV